MQYLTVKIGNVFNLFPLGIQGIDETAVIKREDINNEVEEKLCIEMEQTVKSYL